VSELDTARSGTEEVDTVKMTEGESHPTDPVGKGDDGSREIHETECPDLAMAVDTLATSEHIVPE